MSRRSNRVGVLLSVCCLAGCGGGGPAADGGQTGQPTTGICGIPIPITEPVDGVSGQQLLDAFTGRYTGTLHSPNTAAMPSEQALSIEIAPSSTQETESWPNPCEHKMQVSVRVDLSVANSYRVNFDTELSAASGTLGPASLSSIVEGAVIRAKLDGPRGSVHIEGSIESFGIGGSLGAGGSDVAAGGYSAGLFSGDQTSVAGGAFGDGGAGGRAASDTGGAPSPGGAPGAGAPSGGAAAPSGGAGGAASGSAG
jgi:hypothetical protein